MPLPRKPPKKPEKPKVTAVSVRSQRIPLTNFYQRTIKRTLGKNLTETVNFRNDGMTQINGHIKVNRGPGKPIANVRFISVMSPGKKEVLVYDIAVKKAYRTQGLTQQLLTEIVHLVKTKSTIRRIILEVDPANKDAIKSYTTFGFKPTGKHVPSNKGKDIEMAYEIK